MRATLIVIAVSLTLASSGLAASDNGFVAQQGLFVQPTAVTDNDLLRVVATGAFGCAEPELESVAVADGVVTVLGVVPETGILCLLPVSFALAADVGPLEEGSYRVDVFLEDRDVGGPSILWGSKGIEVTDAPDIATLVDGRFAVEVSWSDFDGNSGAGRVVPGRATSAESVLFSFFERGNWELMLKVLDGCGFNGHWWLLGAASTNVEYTLRVTDTTTGAMRVIVNPLGVSSPAITDVEAFACP